MADVKIEAQKPNIVRIAYHQEQGDPYYGSCMWAYYDFDLDKYMLNIQSDAGNAAYRWVATPDSESFLQLMARIDDDYLLNKLFEESVVDIEATKRELREWLESMDMDDGEIDDAMEDFDNKLDEDDIGRNISMAYRVVEDWNRENDLEIDMAFELVQTDFTAGEKRIVQIFADHVQPMIRELLKDDALALMKAEEPLTVLHMEPGCMSGRVGYCPKCGAVLLENGYHPKYCGTCGQAVKWDAES